MGKSNSFYITSLPIRVDFEEQVIFFTFLLLSVSLHYIHTQGRNGEWIITKELSVIRISVGANR